MFERLTMPDLKMKITKLLNGLKTQTMTVVCLKIRQKLNIVNNSFQRFEITIVRLVGLKWR
jgi:hypothetical protein